MAPRRVADGAVTARHDRSAEVIEAAIAVFTEKGYASTSIQELADAVGVLKGSLYYYIDSKEGLLASIFEGSDHETRAIMEAAMEADLGAADRLHLFVREWCHWHLLHVDRAAVYANDWKQLVGERLERVKAERREYERFVIGLIDDVKAEGAAGAELDSRCACYLILTAISQLPSWYRAGGRDAPGRIADIYADMSLRMVCATRARR